MILGIDLGTSNCAVAFADPSHGRGAAVTDFPVPQLQRLGEVAPRPLLPSFVYLPSAHELPAASTLLPWGDSPDRVVGEFARWQGSRVPGRLVSSAKSWLCHPAVDRSAPILPWGAPAEVTKISPVTASAAYLRHIANAWNSEHPRHPLDEQEVVITVPASFDEVARALTVQAAREAGFAKFTLIEEPEAAFYDFTSRRRDDLNAALEGMRLVLVVDVGGGTTDFTLVRVATTGDAPELERIAVGDHLMLGGDNMDAAVARHVEERLVAGGRKLTATQWTQLIQNAREAKERLLSAGGPDTARLSIAGGGSQLLGSTISAQLARAEIEQLVIEGFFPRCSAGDTARRSSRAALQELGLPYAQDPAITRHLADFLRKHAAAAFAALGEMHAQRLPRPDAILLNGGVFNSDILARRLVEVVSSWWPGQPTIPLLPHDSLDLAVARGAAYYGLVRHGLGLRITGGSAHALYVGLASPDPAAPPQAICVIPRGHEQGDTVEFRERLFQLALGTPVQFPLYSSSSDRRDRAGAIVQVTDELQPLPPIHTVLTQRAAVGRIAPRALDSADRPEGQGNAQQEKHSTQGKSAKGRPGAPISIPIYLRATLTEIGTLELSCVSTTTNEQWRLEFELRGAAAEAGMVVTQSMPPRYSEARQAIEHIFAPKGRPAKITLPPDALPRDVKQLWASLERSLGPRGRWSVPVLRELWTALFAGAPRRRRTAEHERIFFQLIGFCLRPGFGYPLDEWRCSETFSIFAQTVEFHKEKPNWNEFWILWRRLAPGLNEAQQVQIFEYLAPHLRYRLLADQKGQQRPKGIQPEGLDEVVKTAASLEQLSPEQKEQLGKLILPKLQNPATAAAGPWAWALGRLGARVPIRGSTHKVIGAATATGWIDELLRVDWQKVDGAPFAVAQLARRSGDRARDLDVAIRERVVVALTQANAPASWIESVKEVVTLDTTDEARVLGDTLPPGLKLIVEPPPA